MEEDTLVSKSEYIMRQNLFFSEILDKEQWMTKHMLQECQQEVKSNMFLADIAIQKNYLTHEIVAGIYAKNKILYCPYCHHQVKNEIPTSRKALCLECQKTCILPGKYPFFRSKKMTQSMQELCCTDWGNYHMQYCLGSGGMGEVYRAIQKGLNRPVAIKILSPQLANNPQIVKRFQKEARLAAQISHPNLVQIYDVGNYNNYYFIAMEYVNGCPLQNKITRDVGLPIQSAVHYLYQSAKGLKALHSREIIHRDIKPDNIMIGNNGELKLTDFGLAKFEDDSQELTKHGAIIGTPYYMAPEQCLGKAATKLSDIYSLGLTFYYMVKGNLPYKGENTLEIITGRINNPSPRLKAELPKKIEQIYEKTISDNPEKRYQNIEELILDIEKLTEKDYEKNISRFSWKYVGIIFLFLIILGNISKAKRHKKNTLPQDEQVIKTDIIEQKIDNNSNDTTVEDSTEENHAVDEEIVRQNEALANYDTLLKQKFSSMSAELLAYQSFLEKYPFFTKKEIIEQKIDSITKEMILHEKSSNYIDYLEEKQWEILFGFIKELKIIDDSSIQNQIDKKYQSRWVNVKNNIALMEKVKAEQEAKQKKILLLELKDKIPEKWENNFSKIFSSVDREANLIDLWENHFIKLQKLVAGRTYDGSINLFLGDLQEKIKDYKGAESFRRISNLLDKEKDILSNVRDLWEAYTNNIFQFTESGQTINVKETPVENVTNNAYRICREKNYEENTLWIGITFFCLFEKNLELSEKALKKINDMDENVVNLYQRHVYYAKVLKEQTQKELSKIEIQEILHRKLQNLFHGKITMLEADKYNILYDFSKTQQLNDFERKGFWYIKNDILKVPIAGSLDHKILWENECQLDIKISIPIVVTFRVGTHKMTFDIRDVNQYPRFTYQNGNNINKKNLQKFREPTLTLLITIENKELVVQNTAQIIARKPYTDSDIYFGIDTLAQEINIFSLEIKGKINQNWLKENTK